MGGCRDPPATPSTKGFAEPGDRDSNGTEKGKVKAMAWPASVPTLAGLLSPSPALDYLVVYLDTTAMSSGSMTAGSHFSKSHRMSLVRLGGWESRVAERNRFSWEHI